MAGRLPYGPRDELITAAVAVVLDALRASGSTIERRELDEAEAASYLADHLRRVLRRHLDAVPRSARPRAQAEIANRLIADLAADGLDAVDHDDQVALPAAILTSLQPALPPGGTPAATPMSPIDLDRQATAIVLDHVRQALRVRKPELVDELKRLTRDTCPPRSRRASRGCANIRRAARSCASLRTCSTSRLTR